VGIGSSAGQDGSGKNGYVRYAWYLHGGDAIDVVAHNRTCTQGETCSKLTLEVACSLHREVKPSRLGRARARSGEKGGVLRWTWHRRF
jgi:hypothetical protein